MMNLSQRGVCERTSSRERGAVVSTRGFSLLTSSHSKTACFTMLNACKVNAAGPYLTHSPIESKSSSEAANFNVN